MVAPVERHAVGTAADTLEQINAWEKSTLAINHVAALWRVLALTNCEQLTLALAGGTSHAPGLAARHHLADENRPASPAQCSGLVRRATSGKPRVKCPQVERSLHHIGDKDAHMNFR
jgi:hypothetical protein